jgi:hypothetical protein
MNQVDCARVQVILDGPLLGALDDPRCLYPDQSETRNLAPLHDEHSGFANLYQLNGRLDL